MKADVSVIADYRLKIFIGSFVNVLFNLFNTVIAITKTSAFNIKKTNWSIKLHLFLHNDHHLLFSLHKNKIFVLCIHLYPLTRIKCCVLCIYFRLCIFKSLQIMLQLFHIKSARSIFTFLQEFRIL